MDQCSAFNQVPYDGILYKWYPHYDDDNPCTLTCEGKPQTDPIENGGRSGETLIVVRLADKVQDGTRCRPGSLDMCIDGKCQVSVILNIIKVNCKELI